MHAQQHAHRVAAPTTPAPSLTAAVASASPKKKPARHVVTRQIFALPMLQQFEPVLASSPRSYMVPTGSIPRIDKPGIAAATSRSQSSNNTDSVANSRPNSSLASPMRPSSPAVVEAAPALRSSILPNAPPQRPRDGVSSPRVLRPQPPLPLGISARTDVDIYRYSQSAAQRMAIRPLFEQRREDEAAAEMAARQINMQHEQQQQQHERSDTAELAALPSAADFEAMTPQTHTLDLTQQRSYERVCSKFETSVLVVSPAVTGDSAASPTQSYRISSSGSDDSPDGLSDPVSDSHNSAHVDTSASAAVIPTASTDAAVTPSATEPTETALHLVTPLAPGRYYEPFRAVERTTFAIQTKDLAAAARPLILPQRVSGTQSLLSSTPSMQPPARVLYKVLWRDLRSFDDCGDVKLALLLSSDATAHITATVATESLPVTIAITEMDVTRSKQLRPDLRVFTPMWAKWMLVRVQHDRATDTFVLQLDNTASHATAPSQVFNDSSVVVDGCKLCVTMHVVDANLLVTASDVSSGATRNVLLTSSEICELAALYRRTLVGADGDSSNGMDIACLDVATALQDQSFLAYVATTSAVIRLGIRQSCELDAHVSLCTAHSLDSEHALGDSSDDVDCDLYDRQQKQQQAQTPTERCDGLPPEVSSLLRGSSALAAVAAVAQAFALDALVAALQLVQQQEAVALHAKSYVHAHAAAAAATSAAFSDCIAIKVERAKMTKLQELGVAAVVDDWIAELIAYESRVALDAAKASGGFDDHFATKVQATFRMAKQRRQYEKQRSTRVRAAQLLQALQRGIAARKRYCVLKRERERYLFDSVRSSLHAATAHVEDPRQRVCALAKATERRRQSFLMHVLTGYAAEYALPAPLCVSTALVASLFSEYGVVVGCPAAFGSTVVAFLNAYDSDREDVSGGREPLYSSRAVHAALLTALRTLFDDTFGLSTATRRLNAGSTSSATDDTNGPPRWLLKASAPYQRTNRTQRTALRLARKAAGRRACHLVAAAYRVALATEPLAQFETCRAAWELSIRARRNAQRELAASSLDDVVQCALDLVIASIKGAYKHWGVDPEPLFAGLNLCVRHRRGRDIVALVEAKFDAFAEGVNRLHGKRNILNLRDELTQELEDLEQLVALRCLNVGRDDVVTVPPSELLHLILLHSRIDVEYVRHALPTVLPVASIGDKYALARLIVCAFADAADGDALLAICWSCLDAAENVTVEAAQLLDRITRLDAALSVESAASAASAATVVTPTQSSVASRALFLLTDAQAVQFLHFIARAAHYNRATQHRTLALLAPFAARFTMYRVASAVVALDDYRTTTQLFAASFAAEAVYPCEGLWRHFEALFGRDAAADARASARTSALASALASAGDGDSSARGSSNSNASE